MDPEPNSKFSAPMLLVWIGIKLSLLVLLLDATETIVLYQNY